MDRFCIRVAVAQGVFLFLVVMLPKMIRGILQGIGLRKCLLLAASG